MSSIFGGSSQPGKETSNASSQSNSSSSNQAYPMLSQALGGQLGNAGGASNSLAAMLGIGGDPSAQNQAFDNWRNSTGYQFGMDQGTQAITGGAASKGLLNSGSTGKALEQYGQNYANTQYQNYLNPLQSLIGSGNQAGSVIGGAGNVSDSSATSSSVGKKNSTKDSKAGLGDFASSAAMMFL